MLFNSPIFLFLFLPIVITFYFLIPSKGRNGFLLIASIIFYIWGERNLFLVVVLSTITNYFFANAIDTPKSHRKPIFYLAVVCNILVLVYFKYFHFFLDNIDRALVVLNLSQFLDMPKIVLPLGISFFTFHNISYLIDIYTKKTRSQKNIIDFSLYIVLFPQLLAGPIVRYHQIYKQLESDRKVNFDAIAHGIVRFIVGLSKKTLIANNFAVIADKAFNAAPSDLSPQIIWVGAIAYMIQIYFDFSGYSDMAIGLARIFGFQLPENFNFPYRSLSITDFWRRWHMSLSNWFKEYVYIPLGGNQHGKYRTYLNLLIVFLLCGFWHGASWSFIFWGLWHGSFLVLERACLAKWLTKLPVFIRSFYTLTIVLIGWIIFRSPSVTYSFFLIKTMVNIKLIDFSKSDVLSISTLFFLVSMAIAVGAFSKTCDLRKNHSATYVFSLLLLLASLLTVVIQTYNPFIYYNF